MGDHDEGIKHNEDEVYGAEGDNADMADDDHDLSAMEAQMAELEEEQRKLKQIQSDIEGQMNLSSSTQGSHSNLSMLSPEEKAEVDARSVYVGNVDCFVSAGELESHFHGCGSVNRVTILCDKFAGHPKGYACIEFTEREGVQNALAMTDSLLKGKQIKVSTKRTNKSGILTTNNRPPRGRGNFVTRGRGVICAPNAPRVKSLFHSVESMLMKVDQIVNRKDRVPYVSPLPGDDALESLQKIEELMKNRLGNFINIDGL